MAALSTLADSRNMSSIEINVDIRGITSAMEFRVRVKISFERTTKCSSIYTRNRQKRRTIFNRKFLSTFRDGCQKNLILHFSNKYNFKTDLCHSPWTTLRL